MPSIKHFYLLEIEAFFSDALCLDRLPEALLLVTDGGLTEEGALGKHRLLQLCLLNTELFQFTDALSENKEYICDTRNDGKRLCKCRNRSKLVAMLAEILRKYDSNYAWTYVGMPHLQWRDANKAVDCVGSVLSIFFALRDKGYFSKRPKLHYLHKQTVADMHETLADIVKALTPSDFNDFYRHESRLLPANFCTFFNRVVP